MLMGALAVAMLLIAGCSSSDDGDAQFSRVAGDMSGPNEGAETPRGLSGGGDDGDFDGEAADEQESAPTAPDDRAADASTGASPVVLNTIDLGRSIIYTATIDIQVDDVTAASRRAQEQIAAVGGVIFSQDTVTTPRARTTLVFKVPPADFAEAMSRLEGIGQVVSQDIRADDVTARVVDLQSRILTSEVSVERLRRLLDGATSVEAIAALEGQLLDRETNLELLRGQLRTIQAQVALATITVTISQEAAESAIDVAVTAYDGDDEGDRCPGERRLTVDEGESVILCVAITNAGNVLLGDIEVRDLGLDLRREDFSLIGFDEDDRLAPGETVIAWAQFEPERNSVPRPNVSAVPVTDTGEPIRTSTQVTEDPVDLDVIEDDSLPGFVDSLGYGWDVLQQVFGVAVVGVGALAPFAVVVGVPVAALVWWRRRNEFDHFDDLDVDRTDADSESSSADGGVA
jgi:hypothetical protein